MRASSEPSRAHPQPVSHSPLCWTASIDVVVVNYETPHLLDECLQSVNAHQSDVVGSVIVVDNSITSTSIELVRRQHPGVVVIRPLANLGYGAAANQGCRAGQGDYALVLNADTQLHAGALEALVDELIRHPEAAVAGPQLVDPHGRDQPSCANFPTPGRMLLHETGLWKLLRTRRLRARVQPFFNPAAPARVPWVLGAAVAVRRRCFDAVGGFDPSYFMYFEEVDLCRRLSAAGADTRFVPNARVIHVGGASTALARAPMQRDMFRSLARYTRRHHNAANLVALRVAVTVVALIRLVYDFGSYLASRRGRGQRADANGWFAIMLDAARGWPDD